MKDISKFRKWQGTACLLLRTFKFLLVFLIIFKVLPSHALLIAEPNSIELGEVKREVSLKKYILVKNEGNKPVKILGIINQCGINFYLPKKEIEPGTVTEALLDFYSSTAIGQFREKIKIVYQEEEVVKETTVSVSWETKPNIYSDIQISPKSFNFGKVPLNKPIDFELEIINKGTAKGVISTIKRDSGISFIPNIELEGGERKVFKGTVMPAETGKIEKKIVLEIKDFTSPLQEITFSYEAQGDIIEGTYIELKNVERETSVYKVPVIITNGNQELQFLSVETPSGEKLKISEKPPFYIFKNEKKEFYLLLDEKDYEKLKSSYFYFTIGVRQK